MIRNFTLMVAVCTAMTVSVSAAQTNEKHQKISRQLVAEANSILQSDKSEEARHLYERALVANPSNIHALIGLGKSYDKAGKVGRSLKYYRQALEIEPNDLQSLMLQGKAFLKKGMADKAEHNRAKLTHLCAAGCGELEMLDTAISEHLIAEADTSGTVATASEDSPEDGPENSSDDT